LSVFPAAATRGRLTVIRSYAGAQAFGHRPPRRTGCGPTHASGYTAATMLWLKALHIVFMVTWFAGLFYLPRLFVYHVAATEGVSRERFEIMERRLFAIMTLGAVLTIIFGLAMLWR